MTTTAVITAIHVSCPLCGHSQTFADPPRLRSMVCGGCDYYVCESEWHNAFMQRVNERFKAAIERAKTTEPR